VGATRQTYGGAVPQQSTSYLNTRAGRRLYRTLIAHRSPSTSSSTSLSVATPDISRSVTTPDISKYAGMSADQINERIRQIDLEKEKREIDRRNKISATLKGQMAGKIIQCME
jgi:hypothetical protein